MQRQFLYGTANYQNISFPIVRGSVFLLKKRDDSLFEISETIFSAIVEDGVINVDYEEDDSKTILESKTEAEFELESKIQQNKKTSGLLEHLMHNNLSKVKVGNTFLGRVTNVHSIKTSLKLTHRDTLTSLFDLIVDKEIEKSLVISILQQIDLRKRYINIDVSDYSKYITINIPNIRQVLLLRTFAILTILFTNEANTHSSGISENVVRKYFTLLGTTNLQDYDKEALYLFLYSFARLNELTGIINAKIESSSTN